MAVLHARRYRPGDREAVWTIHERAFRASPLPFVEDAPVDRDLRQIREAYLEAGGEFLVGCVEPDATDSASGQRPRAVDDVVAVGGFLPTGNETVEIRRMRVDPDHQRNGYGATMLSSLEDAARQDGYERAVLETHELLAAAQRLYEAAGYRETGREEGRDGNDRIRYEKDL